MSLKTSIVLTVLAVWGIFEVHTASIASEKDSLNKLDAGWFLVIVNYF